MAIHFHTKVAQIFGNYFGCFGKWHNFSGKSRDYFWRTIGTNWATFNSTSGHTVPNGIMLHQTKRNESLFKVDIFEMM